MKYNIPALRNHYYRQLVDRKPNVSYQSVSDEINDIIRRLQEMSALSEKLAAAGKIVGRQTQNIIARADALIAREADIENKTNQAFQPHESMMDDAMKGLDDLERQLATLTNGGAPLDASSPGSTPGTAVGTQPATLNVTPAKHPLAVDKDGRVIG
jgi:predicted transcriptional regulator